MYLIIRFNPKKNSNHDMTVMFTKQKYKTYEDIDIKDTKFIILGSGKYSGNILAKGNILNIEYVDKISDIDILRFSESERKKRNNKPCTKLSLEITSRYNIGIVNIKNSDEWRNFRNIVYPRLLNQRLSEWIELLLD